MATSITFYLRTSIVSIGCKFAVYRGDKNKFQSHNCKGYKSKRNIQKIKGDGIAMLLNHQDGIK